jgi:hypothetical protein
MIPDIVIDLSRLEDVFHRLPVDIERIALKEIKNQTQEAQLFARKNHRFMNTSGRRPTGRYYRNTHMLVKSINTMSDGSGSTLYLETGIAKYAPYVHEGQKDQRFKKPWAPDQFIYGAAKHQEPNILPAIEAACQKVLDEI